MKKPWVGPSIKGSYSLEEAKAEFGEDAVAAVDSLARDSASPGQTELPPGSFEPSADPQ